MATPLEVAAMAIDGFRAEVTDLRAKLRRAQEERDRAYKEKGTLFLDVIRAKDKCDAAIERAEAAEALARDICRSHGIPLPSSLITPAEAQVQQ